MGIQIQLISLAFAAIIRSIQVGFLRLTLSSPKYANQIGKVCIGAVGLGVGLEDVTGSIHIYKTVTLLHLIIATGSVGGVLSRLAVKDPAKLQVMIDTLQGKTKSVDIK